MNKAQLTLLDIAESSELECKLASGRDGKGKLPDDFWPTYCGFANAQGGVVILGVKEKPIGTFHIEGIFDVKKVVTELFNNVNNRKKVSCNLLTDKDVEVLSFNGLDVIRINVRRANRHEKPVHLGSSPFNGSSFKRLYDGDRPMDDESVRRLIAERVEDERDSLILQGFDFNDIDKRSLTIYRQMLKDAKGATHPFLVGDDFELLKKLRGWRKDRQSGDEGLTLAGILMFGTWDAIQEAAPHYFVDYQERPEAKTERRWIDRVYPDGTWSGNLFDFYRIVYRKLTDPETLKIPFRLKEGQRQDDTPIHEAIREALVNTIVHADYSGRVSILVVKRPDMMGFRNPGDMRIPLARAVQGGDSDCRNRIMHQIFLMIGLGERAGSGLPKIYSSWNWRHWRTPALYEIAEPPQTLLELRMLELMPEGVLEQLHEQFGDRFNVLPVLERLILATAATEQVVSHKRITEICAEHVHDITIALRSLVADGLLHVNGHGRGAMYALPGQILPTPEQVFGEPVYFDSNILISSEDKTGRSEDKTGRSEDKTGRSEDKTGRSEDKTGRSEDKTGRSEDKTDHLGRLISPHLSAPVVYDLSKLDPDYRLQLEVKASLPRNKKRLAKAEMRTAILLLCTEQFITRQCLAELVNRDPDSLRQQYLTELVDDKKLILAFPQSPTDSRQAYIKG